MDAPDIDVSSVDAGAEDDPATPTDGRPRRSPWSTIGRAAPTTVVLCLLVAIAVRRYLAPTNADALLPSLMSTQRWTVFYWGQDRLANVVPLLTMPIRDPIWNFRFQTMLIAGAFFGTGAAFVSFHAWARGLRIGGFEHAAATLIAGLIVMVPFHTGTGYRFAVEQLYFVSVLSWIGASWLWTGRRYVIAAVLLVGATFLNPSLLAVSPLIWLLDADASQRLRRSVAFVAASAVAFVLTDVVGALVDTGPDVDYPYDEFRWSRVEEGMREVSGNVAGSVRDNLATVIVVLTVIVVAITAKHVRRRALAVYAVVPLFAGAWFVAFSANAWIEQNLYEYRYFYPLYVTFMLYVAAATTELVLGTRSLRSRTTAGETNDVPTADEIDTADEWRRTRALGAAGLAGVVVAVVATIIVVHRTEVPLLEQSEVYVDAAEHFDADLVAGNYWSVWPAVVAGRSAGVDLIGVTYRSDPIEDEIRDVVDRTGDSGLAVVCAGVGSDDCARRLGDWSGRAWHVDQQLQEWPLVIRVVPAG